MFSASCDATNDFCFVHTISVEKPHLALDRARGMGWDLTEGEGAAEPLAVEVVPAPLSVAAPCPSLGL
jgi:hypothetical protein